MDPKKLSFTLFGTRYRVRVTRRDLGTADNGRRWEAQLDHGSRLLRVAPALVANPKRFAAMLAKAVGMVAADLLKEMADPKPAPAAECIADAADRASAADLRAAEWRIAGPGWPMPPVPASARIVYHADRPPVILTKVDDPGPGMHYCPHCGLRCKSLSGHFRHLVARHGWERKDHGVSHPAWAEGGAKCAT